MEGVLALGLGAVGPTLHTGEAGHPAHAGDGLPVGDEPLGHVAVGAGRLAELAEGVVVVAGEGDRLGLDDEQLAGDARQALEGQQRVAHVAEEAEAQHDVERAQPVEVHRHEVADDALDLAVECPVGDVEARFAR